MLDSTQKKLKQKKMEAKMENVVEINKQYCIR